MSKERITTRLRRLRDWEEAAVLLMPAIAVYVWPEIDSYEGFLIRATPLVMVSLILAQGTLYWHLKLQSMRNRVALPIWFCDVFRHIKVAAKMGLMFSGVLILATYGLGDGSGTDLAWGLGLLTFAILEYVNYFHVQLMHDSFADWRYLARHRQLREAPLRTDLQRRCR